MLLCALIALVAIYQNMQTNPTNSNISDNEGSFVDSTPPTECPDILLGSTYGATRENLKLSKQGAATIAISLIVGIFCIVGWKLESALADKIDASWSTTQDYGVTVTNPPKECNDPEEYRRYFNQFVDSAGGGVCCVTIAKNNGDLCTTLALKKLLQQQRSDLVKSGNRAKKGDLPLWKRMMQPAGYFVTTDFLDESIAGCEAKLTALSQKDYYPWRVYAIFNTEIEQRECLRRTAPTGAQKFGFDGSSTPEQLLRDTRLNICEAPEPSDIIYNNTHKSSAERFLSWACSYFVCSCVVVGAFFVIRALANNGSVGAAVFISIVNSCLPVFAKIVTVNVEIHNRHSSIQYAILAKLVVIRCMISGVIIFISAPFDETFSLSHLQSIMNILLADAISTPLLRFMDVYGAVDRWVLGYFTKSQAELNQLWTPADWTLAERYTDILKTILWARFLLSRCHKGYLLLPSQF
jgi:hypothetical protein